MPDNFTLRYGSENDLLERIAAAYRIAGLTPPNRADELRTLLDAEPSPETVAGILASESLGIKNVDEWLEDALDQVQRAQAVAELRRVLELHRAGAVQSNRGRLVREAVTDLTAPFDAVAKRLADAAEELPPGDLALDLQAVVDLDATRQQREALAALTTMAVVCSIFHAVSLNVLTAPQRDVLTAVDVPEVAQQEVNRLNREPVNPDPVRDEVRRFLICADRQGKDRALIGVARSEFGPGISVTLAADGAELKERMRRCEVAVVDRPVETTYRRPPLKAPMPTTGY